MRSIPIGLAFVLFAKLAFATTPGVSDYVTAYKISDNTPNCLQFQTANAGGDTTNHTYVANCNVGGLTCYGIGLGTGTNSLGSNLGAAAIGAIINSRLLGSSTGPYINFTDVGANGVSGHAPDCPSTTEGVNPLTY